jgi:hypothetical protein
LTMHHMSGLRPERIELDHHVDSGRSHRASFLVDDHRMWRSAQGSRNEQTPIFGDLRLSTGLYLDSHDSLFKSPVLEHPRDL